MVLRWIRLTDKVSIAFVDGRVLTCDRAIIRRADGNKGNYDFEYSNGRTKVLRTEHPEWARAWGV